MSFFQMNYNMPICHFPLIVTLAYLSPFKRYGQFFVKNAHFSYPPLFNLGFENVSLGVNC